MFTFLQELLLNTIFEFYKNLKQFHYHFRSFCNCHVGRKLKSMKVGCSLMA